MQGLRVHYGSHTLCSLLQAFFSGLSSPPPTPKKWEMDLSPELHKVRIAEDSLLGPSSSPGSERVCSGTKA